MFSKALGKLIGKMLAILLRAIVETCIHLPYGAVGALLWPFIQILCPWLWNPPIVVMGPIWWLIFIVGMLAFGFMSEYVWRPFYSELTEAA